MREQLFVSYWTVVLTGWDFQRTTNSRRIWIRMRRLWKVTCKLKLQSMVLGFGIATWLHIMLVSIWCLNLSVLRATRNAGGSGHKGKGAAGFGFGRCWKNTRALEKESNTSMEFDRKGKHAWMYDEEDLRKELLNMFATIEITSKE